MSELVECVGKGILVFLKAQLTLVCTALVVVPICSCYRTIQTISVLLDADDLEDYWQICILQFLMVIGDICVLPLALISLFSIWRTPFVIGSLREAWGDGDSDTKYNSEIRLTFIFEFLILLGDIITLVPFIFLVCTFIRMPRVVAKIKTSSGRSDYNYKPRMYVWEQFFELLLDLLFIPLAIPLFFSWRNKKLMHQINKYQSRVNLTLAVVAEFFKLLIDIPFVLMLIVISVTLWRAVPFWKELTSSIKSRRKLIFTHFAKLFFQDVPTFILFVITLGFLYRFPFLILEYLNTFKKPPMSPSHLHIEDAAIDFPKKGVVLHLKGTKNGEYVIDDKDQPLLYVLGDEFWSKGILAYTSSTMASMAQGFLPMKLNSENIDSGFLREDETRFQGSISLGTNIDAAKRETVGDFLHSLELFGNNTPIEIVIEYKDNMNERAVLLAITMNPSEMGTIFGRLAEDEKEVEESSEDQHSTESEWWKKRKITVVTKPLAEIVSDDSDSNYLDKLAPICLKQTGLLLYDLFVVLILLKITLLSPFVLPRLIKRLKSTQTQHKKWKAYFAIEKLRYYENLKRQEYFGTQEYNIQYCERNFQHPDGFTSFAKDALIHVSELVNATENSEEFHVIWKKIEDLESSHCAQRKLLSVYRLNLVGKNSNKRSAHEYLISEFKSEHSNTECVEFADITPELVAKIEDEVKNLRKEIEGEYEKFGALQEKLLYSLNYEKDENRSLEWGTKRTIILEENREPSLNNFGLICVVFIVATLYRIYPFVRGLLKRKHSMLKWRDVAMDQAKELLLDLRHLIMFLLICMTVVRLPEVFFRVLNAIVVERGVSKARDIIEDLFDEVGEAISDLFEAIFTFKTYKVLLATIIWGLFIPAEMFSKCLKNYIGKFKRRFVAFILLGITFGYPFFHVIYVNRTSNSDRNTENSVNENTFSIFFYIIFLLLSQLLVLFWARRRHMDDEQTYSLVKIDHKVYDIHWNLTNAISVLSLILEVYQHIALAFTVNGLAYSGHEVTESISKPILFDFGYVRYDLPVIIAVIAVGIWFLISSLPTVAEDMFDMYDEGTISRSALWNLFETVFSSTFVVLIVTNLMKPLACHLSNGVYVSNISSEVQCYSGHHSVVALLALIALGFYVPTSFMVRAMNAERDGLNPKLDLFFTGVFALVANAAKFCMVAVTMVFSTNVWIALSSVLVVNLVLALYTLLYSSFHHGSEPASTPLLWLGRGFGFLAAAWTAICLMVAAGGSSSANVTPGIMLIVGYSVLLLLLLAIWVIIRKKSKSELIVTEEGQENQGQTAQAHKELCMEFAKFEQRIPEDSLLFEWKRKDRKGWRRLIRNQKRRIPIGQCERCIEQTKILGENLMELEENIDFSRFPLNYYTRTLEEIEEDPDSFEIRAFHRHSFENINASEGDSIAMKEKVEEVAAVDEGEITRDKWRKDVRDANTSAELLVALHSLEKLIKKQKIADSVGLI